MVKASDFAYRYFYGNNRKLLNQLSSLITLWVGAYLVIQGDLTIGQLIAFRIISGYVVGPLINLATSWQTFSVALSLERLSDVVDAYEGSENELDQLPLPPVAGEVIFQGIDFRFVEVVSQLRMLASDWCWRDRWSKR